MYKDIYNRKDLLHHISPSGNGFRIKRGWMYEDGEMIYKEKGITNVYEEIQSYKDQVDIHNIMKRFENGDESALDKVQGMYIDTVDLPKNYAQLYDAISKTNTIFESMPAEIKAAYNNDAAKFWKEYGTETFDAVINNYRAGEFARYGMVDDKPVDSVADVKAKTVESEVTDNVEKSE